MVAAEAGLALYAVEAAAVSGVLGEREYPLNKVLRRQVDLSLPTEQVHHAVCGIRFSLGVVSSLLPEAPGDKLLIPAPYLMQIVNKPRMRAHRSGIANFALLTAMPLEEVPPPPPPMTPPPDAKRPMPVAAPPPPVKGKPGAVEEVVAVAAPPPPPPRNLVAKTRWVLPPNSSTPLVVQFQSDLVGRCTETLGFEVLGGERSNTVLVTGTCDHPHISADYRNVFYKKVKARPQTPTIARQYVISKNMFEFGPLLINKDATGYTEGAHPDNTARMRITNNGLYDLHVDFMFRSKDLSFDTGKSRKGMTPKPAGGKAAKGSLMGLQLESVFTLGIMSMDLKIDETQDLTVYAFPTEEGALEDVIVCRIVDNPTPVEFPVSVIGSKPQIYIRLDDGSPAPYMPPTDSPSPPPPPSISPTPGGRGKDGGVPVNKILTEGILFERLLVGKRDVKAFIITNPGLLPFKWRLAGSEKLPSEFSVYPSSGTVPARSDVRVMAEFAAVEKRLVEHRMILEVSDAGELQGVATSIPLLMKGEAYKIEVDVRFPEVGLTGIDFGMLRVVDSLSKMLILKNTGKYSVQFSFAVKPGSPLLQILTIAPESGNIDPMKELQIQVHFNKEHKLRREVVLVGSADLTLSITEPLTKKREDDIPIKISARVVFSKYAVTPARGINFGPTTYNTLSKAKTFEVANFGEFPFTVKLFSMEVGLPQEAAPELGKKGQPVAAKAAALVNKGPLTLGQFTFDPSEAVVPPGGRQDISVVFKAMDAKSFTETLGVHITERDPADQPLGIPYEVGGESCVPGIDAQNLESIFEEHTIRPTLDPTTPGSNEFGLRERTFNFGAVIAQLGDAPVVLLGAPTGPGSRGSTPASARSSKPGTPADKNVRANKAAAAAAEKAGAEAAAAALVAEAAAQRGGVCANLKFINPVKVPCTVTFNIKPRGVFAPGTFPIDVFPQSMVIPPHEYRYTTVYFVPRAIMPYNCTFEAVVQDGGDAATKIFSCDMKGEGTLPTLSVVEPSGFDPAGRPLLKFPRLLRGRTARLSLLLKNGGILPAGARLEMEPHPCFTLLEGPQVFTVESKRAANFTVEFCPTEVKTYAHDILLHVRDNPYEDYSIALAGEGYQDDVTWEALPEGSLDELHLADAPVGGQRTAHFAIRNHTGAKNFRFKFPPHPTLKFSPSIGHLHAGTSKDIFLTFQAEQPVRLAPADIKVVVTQINYKGEVVDWDDRAVLLDFDSTGTGAHPSPAPAATPTPTSTLTRGGAGVKEPTSKADPEPPTSDVSGSNRDLFLKVHAVADNVKYTCDAVSPVLFRPTMMFQTRTFQLPLANTSNARMDFRFTVMTADGSRPDTSRLYSVSPEGGVIPAGGSTNVTIKFSPLEVEDCARLLVCAIPDLDPSLPPLQLDLNGRVTRPWCHFELPESDYVSAGRRNPEMAGPSGAVEPLNPETKVLELSSLGVKVRNTSRFFVLNPTAVSYEFFWERIGETTTGGGGPFTCVTQRGIISGGRRFEMVFEYTPVVDTTAESFWNFKIPEQGIKVPFLLVGLVSEPRVFFDKPALSFGQVIIGGRARQTLTLINNENMPFHFQLDKDSYDASDQVVAAGGKPSLVFDPSSGYVPPNSSLPIVAMFVPQLEQTINYNVLCEVKKKSSKLTLNVKGEGWAIHESLQIEGNDGAAVNLAPRAPNTIDLGQVIINERAVRGISIVNGGAVTFDYIWDVGTNPRVTIKPEGGQVRKGERLTCELTYHPHGPDRLRDYKVTCTIVNGPTYVVLLNGVGHKPRLDLSWTSTDFGLVAIFKAGMTPVRRVLRLRNDDSQPIAIDSHFDNTEEMQVELPSCVLAPGETREAAVIFKPSAAQVYNATLPLEINGLYTLHVTLKGEGTALKVEVVDPTQRTVHFGGVVRGQSSSRVVQIINRGRTATTFSAMPSADILRRCAVEVMPAGEISLRPKETADITFLFRPKERMRAFTEELLVAMAGVTVPLLTLTGACLGTELSLESDILPFGPVVAGSRSVKRLQLENSGDVGTKFVWDTRALGGYFTITPSEGFIAVHQDVKLDVAFAPSEINPDVRVERVRMRVEGGEDRFITLTGACVAATTSTEAVNFACNVRATTTSSIQLTNPSSSVWQLRPTIQNDFFTGPEFISVPAGGKAQYVLTFKPLSMSAPERPHEGTVFFPIPDGSGLLYKLVGRAESPVAERRIEQAVVAKQAHSESLRVANWLHKPQRFKVIIERKQADKATTLEGPEYVDVPALSHKDWKLAVYCYTAGTTQANVTFKNEDSGEYMFYELKFTASPPGPRGSLSLECPVRTQTSGHITLKNVLDTEVTFKGSSTSKQVSVAPLIVMKAGATLEVEVKYRPLLVGQTEAVLRLESAELGLYEYALKLGGVVTNPERGLTYSVPLGGRETQVFRFTHWLEEKAEYRTTLRSAVLAAEEAAAGAAKSATKAAPPPPAAAAKAAPVGAMTTSGPFEVISVVQAPPAPAGGAGVEVQLEVHFEPGVVGEGIKDTLVVTSKDGGEYLFPLVGRCIPPKPQGPIDLSGKLPGAVAFKNVFATEADFLYSVDNPAFIVKPGEKIGSKKAVSIAVSYKPDATRAKTAKLTVSCPTHTTSQWVFYLQA